MGRPLFPGKNVVNQLELITDLLGTPSPEVIAKVCVWGVRALRMWRWWGGGRSFAVGMEGQGAKIQRRERQIAAG